MVPGKTVKGLPSRKISFAIHVLLSLSVFTPLALTWTYLGGKALPWWSDGGNWLKHMHAILGDTRPMWNEGTYQYPPLYFLLLAATSLLLGNEVLALKLTAIFAFCLRPATTYILAKKIFGGRLPALAAAWLASMPPFAVEMLGWGGYPNLLGLAILPVAFCSVLSLTEKAIFKNVFSTLTLALTVVLTHHLTFLVFLGTLALWALWLGLMKMKREWLTACLAMLFTLIFFVGYRLVLAWPPQFILFNEAAYHRLTLTANIGIIMWVFKDKLLLFLLFLSAFLSMILSLEEGFNARDLSLLLAWVMAPLLMSQGNLLGVALDYPRIFMFAVQPLLIMAAMPLSLLNRVLAESSSFKQTLKGDLTIFLKGLKQGKLGGQWRLSGKRLLVCVLAAIALSSTLMNLALGMETINRVELWYRHVDYYGDGEKLNAITWILNNTDPEDVFVAEEKIGRWIEGLGKRPVLLYQEACYLFMEGEIERSYAARAILTSKYGMLNGFVWVFDQAPYGIFSPIVSFRYKGDYENLLYLDLNSSRVEWVSEDGKIRSEPLSNASKIEVEWIERDVNQAALLVRCFMNNLVVERTAKIERAKPSVDFHFRIAPLREDVKPLLLRVEMKEMKNSTVFLDDLEVLPEGKLRFPTYLGPVYVQTTAKHVSADKDKGELVFIFESENGETGLEGEILLQAPYLKGKVQAVFSYEAGMIMARYNVKYVVLPRARKPRTQTFSLETETLFPVHEFLLRDETLLKVYEGKDGRILILEKKAEP